MDPKKFGTSTKIIIWHFHAETKFFGAQIFWGPYFSGTKFLWTQMKLGTKICKGIRPKFHHASVHWYASTNLF